MSEIWFIRHGESEANAGLSSKDPESIPLTPKGENQAERVSEIWQEAPSHIICSPFSRALATAQPTIDRFPSAILKNWPVQEFTYLSPAKCAGTTASQRLPWVEEYWQRSDPDYIDSEDTESFSDLLARVSQTFTSLREHSPNDFSAIFTHGMYMSAILFSVFTGFSRPTSKSMLLYRQFVQATPVPNCAVLKCTINQRGEVFVSSLVAPSEFQ